MAIIDSNSFNIDPNKKSKWISSVDALEVIETERKILKIVEKLEEEHNVKVIYLSYFGSRLHGTDTENSDWDFRGIFIPNLDDILLSKAKNVIDYKTNENKNTKNDIDITLFSLNKFLDSVAKMETTSIELLFSIGGFSELINSEWSEIIKNVRQNLLSNNMKSFLGLAKSKLASDNFKDLAHTKRVLEEAYELLESGKITFPLKSRKEILEIKQGLRDKAEVKRSLKEFFEKVSDLSKEKDINKSININKNINTLKEEIESLKLFILKNFFRINYK